MPETHAPVKRTNARALVAGLLAYALVKLVGVGVATGVGPFEVAAMPALFLPAAGSRLASELVGAGLILLFVVGFSRISPRSGFLAVAVVQMAIGWWAPASIQDTWIRWLFGSSGLAEVWAQMGLASPFEEQRSAMGGLSLADILGCVAAGVIAQTVHNMAVGPRVETPFQTRA